MLGCLVVHKQTLWIVGILVLSSFGVAISIFGDGSIYLYSTLATPSNQVFQDADTSFQFTGVNFTNGTSSSTDLTFTTQDFLEMLGTGNRWYVWNITTNPPTPVASTQGMSMTNANGACFDGTNRWVTSLAVGLNNQVIRLNSTYGYDGNFTVAGITHSGLWCNSTMFLIIDSGLDQVLVYNNTFYYQYNISVAGQEVTGSGINLYDGLMYTVGNSQIVFVYNFSSRTYFGKRFINSFGTILTGIEIDNYGNPYLADANSVSKYSNINNKSYLLKNFTTTYMETLGTTSTFIFSSWHIDYTAEKICVMSQGNDRLNCGFINDTSFNSTAYFSRVSSAGTCSFDGGFVTACDFNHPWAEDGVCWGGSVTDDTMWLIGLNFSDGNYSCIASYTSSAGGLSVDGIQNHMSFYNGSLFHSFATGPVDDTQVAFEILQNGSVFPISNRTASANPCSQDTTDWFDITNRSDGGYDWYTISNTDSVLCKLNVSKDLTTLDAVYFYTDSTVPEALGNANRQMVIDEDDDRVLALNTLTNYPVFSFWSDGASNFSWVYTLSYINTETCAFQGNGPNAKGATNLVRPEFHLDETTDLLYVTSFGLLGSYSGSICIYNASEVYANASRRAYALPLIARYVDQTTPSVNFSGHTLLKIRKDGSEGLVHTYPVSSTTAFWRFNITDLPNIPGQAGSNNFIEVRG